LAYMDRAMLEDHLEKTERHIAQCERHAEAQRARIAELAHDGRSTAQEGALLEQIERLLHMLAQDRDRLREELAANPK
jgi:hypothetical protein